MDQLTQTELHRMGEAIRAQSMTIKKAAAYAEKLQDEPLKKLLNEAADLNRKHRDRLMKQVHELSGGLATREGR